MRLLLAGFYEDHWDTQATPLNDYMPTSMATWQSSPMLKLLKKETPWI